MHASNGRAAGGSSSHAVQFYEDPTVLIDGLGELVGSALGTGGTCLVIATRTHREQLDERLQGGNRSFLDHP